MDKVKKLWFAGIFLTVAMTAVSITAWGAIPVGYYSSINGKRGQDLKNAVHSLLKNHTVVT